MVIMGNCSDGIESHILVQLDRFVIGGPDLQEALLAPVQFQGLHRRNHQLSPDPSSTKLGHNRYRHDVSLSDHAESSEVGEAELKSAHNVSDNMIFALSNDEGFWAALVYLHEKVGAIVFWKTDPVDLDN